MLKPLAVSALALCCFGNAPAFSADVPANYDYPYKDSWLATASVALLKDPKLPEKQVKDAILLPARARTPLFEDKARVYYVTYRQEKPADLVVLISGLGSVAEDPLALYLGGQIFAMGYNVLVVPDAFNWQFALGASASGYVGIPSVDAGDLENFIIHARDHAVRVDGMKVRQTKLVGYSMGALEGAFLAAREAQHPRLKFDKVVLLNPPVDTFYDLHMLDSLAATGENWSADEKKTVKAKAFKLVVDANLTDPQGAPYFRDLAQRNTLTDDQLKYVLFGLFRNSLSDVIMVTQQIRDMGILKTPADKLHLDAREQEAAQYGFEDYLRLFLEPQLGDKRTADQIVKQETLYGLHDFLASHREVEIFHNADDFLVRPQDIAYLQQTLGARLTLFPHGGHMGNIWYPVNQQMLAHALGSGPVPDAVPPVVATPVAVAPIAPPDAVATTNPATAPPAPETSPPAPATTEAAPVVAATGPAVPPVDAAPSSPASVPVPATATPTSLPIPAVEQAASTPAVPTAPATPEPPVSPATPEPSVSPVPASALSPPGETPMPAPVTAVVAPPPASPSPVPTSAPTVPDDTLAAPVTAVVAPPAPVPAEDPLAVPSPGTVTTTTTTTTSPSPAQSPTYTIKIPQIPQATPSEAPPAAPQPPS